MASIGDALPDLATKNARRPKQQPYSLPQSPRLRAGEEMAWAAFLTANPVLWQGGQEKQRAEALKRFADQYRPLYHERCAPPTVSFIVEKLLPGWIAETRADEATLEQFAFSTDPGTSKDELYNVKRWLALQFLSQQDPSYDPRQRIADACADLPFPIPHDDYHRHIAVIRPVLEIIDNKAYSDLRKSELVDDRTHITTLWSHASEIQGLTEADIAKQMDELDRTDRFEFKEKLLRGVKAVVMKEKWPIFTQLSTVSTEAAHIVPNHPSNNPPLYRQKMQLLYMTGFVHIIRFLINHPSNIFICDRTIHTDFDSDRLAITPELDFLYKVDDFLRLANEERTKNARAGEAFGPLDLFAMLETWMAEFDGKIGYNIWRLTEDTRIDFPDSRAGILYTADQPDGLFREFHTRTPAPTFTFTRHSQPYQHEPNPLLFVLNAAAKLAHEANRPIPSAAKESMLLCLSIVLRTFAVPALALPLSAPPEQLSEIATRHLQSVMATITPAPPRMGKTGKTGRA